MKPTDLILLALILIAAPAMVLQAQGEDDNLYIPPKLVVETLWGEGPPVVVATSSVSPGRCAPLPMVFFDHPGEWAIPERYQLFRSMGDALDYADSNALYGWSTETEKYREILNIVGYRMTKDSSITLGLRGSYSLEPGEDSLLGRERSLVVQEYLRDVWQIDTGRIPLLPPTSPVDSTANILLQEEARRVSFESDHPDLFAPVFYRQIVPNPLDLSFNLVITPNINAADVASIEIRMLDERKELLAGTTINGSPDSTVYRLQGSWWMPTDRRTMRPREITMQCRIITTSGRYRTSNRVPIILREKSDEREREIFDRSLYGEIPLFAPGDTLLNSRQKRMIERYFEVKDSLSTSAWEEGFFVTASGQAGMAEDPTRDAAEISAEVAKREENNRIAEWRANSFNAEPERSYLTIFNPVMGDDQLHGYYEDIEGYEEHYYDGEPPSTEDRDSPQENAAPPYSADSIADSRARNVMSYVRDSLGITMLNGQLPSDLGEVLPSMGSLLTTGVGSSTYNGYFHGFLPEDRWYARRVSLYVEDPETFEVLLDDFEEMIEMQKKYAAESDPTRHSVAE